MKMPTFKERNQELQGELSKLTTHRGDLVEAQKKTWNEYHKLLTTHQELKELGEVEKAKQLESELAKLREKVENIKSEVSNMGATSIERIKEAAQNNPDSKLHKLAESVQHSGLVSMSVLEENLGSLISDDLLKAKVNYLNVVRKAGNMVRELFDIYFMVKKAEESLPVEKHKSKQPQRAPEWTLFDIEDEVGKAYGSRPFV